MYQIFQKCNRQRQSSDSANMVRGYEDPFRKRYSTSHRPKKNFKRCDQASRIPEHDVDRADELTDDDEHIVIDVWPPSSVSAEVTWNRPNVATCTTTTHSAESLSPVYSSACTMESSEDKNCSQIHQYAMERRERSISPDTGWPSDVRCSPNSRGCSDARGYSNVNVGWSSYAPGSRKEPSPAVTRWFPEPPDPRWLPAPAARDPHNGRWSQPSLARIEPPDFTWVQSSPGTLPSSSPLDTESFANRGDTTVSPSTFYPAHRQVRNIKWKSGTAPHSNRPKNGVLCRKDCLVVLDSTASSSDSDCPPLSRRPLHSRGQRKYNLTESVSNAQQEGVGEKFTKCIADAGSQSEHHSNLGFVDLSSSLAFRSLPQTDRRLEDPVSIADKQNYVPCDKDNSIAPIIAPIIAPLQADMPCQSTPSRMKHSARKSTGGGYKKSIDLKAQKYYTLTPDRKGLTSCTLKEPLVVIKKVCTGFPALIPNAPSCDPVVVSSSSLVLSEHSVNAVDAISKSASSDNSVVTDNPSKPECISSDNSFLAEPSKPSSVKVGRLSKSLRSGRSAKTKHLMSIADVDPVMAVLPEIIPSDLVDYVSPEHSIVADSHRSSPVPPNVEEPHLALSGSPTVASASHSLDADSRQPSPSLDLAPNRQASTVSVIAGPQQPSGSIGSSLEQIVQHLKRRAEVVEEYSVSTKKRRWNRMPPCSALADPLPPFPTSRSSARLSKKNKPSLNKKDHPTDATESALICEPVTSSSVPFVSEPSTSCKVSVIQGEYAITHINGSPYMALEDRDNWHLQADPLHYDMSLEICMQSPSVGAWTKGAIDAEVQVEAVTPAGCDKEELDSYIKAKLDESLAKELNVKLQHMKKQIDRVLQEKERLEKAHKNAIIKIQSLMRTTLKPSVSDKATSTIGLQYTPDLLAQNDATADSSLLKIRKRNIGVQCEMMLNRQRKRSCGVQTEGLVAFEELNYCYVDKQKGMTSTTNTAPRSTMHCQAEELTVEPLCSDDGICVPNSKSEISTSKSVTAVHKWLATKNENSCARCIRVNTKLSTSNCARSRAHVTLQPTSSNPIHRPPTVGIMKALWKLQLFLTKLPVHQLFLDRFTAMMTYFLNCTSSIFQGEDEPKLAEPVLEMLEHCSEIPGLATYLLGQKLQELCNLLVRLSKLRSYLTHELSRSIETLYRQASETLNLVVSPQYHTQAKDDDPTYLDVESINCSIVSSPCGSDMESDSSADDMDFSHECSESSSSESESCTQESSARTTGRINTRSSASRNVESSCATTRASLSAHELPCSSSHDSTGGGNETTESSMIIDPSIIKVASGTIDNSISPCRQSSGDTCSYQTVHSMERRKNSVNREVRDSVNDRGNASNEHMYTGDQLNNMQQSPVHQAGKSASTQSVSSPNPLLTLVNQDKLNVLLVQLCKQLNETHQRMITNKGTATKSTNSSNAQMLNTSSIMSAQSLVAQSPLGTYVQELGLIPLVPVTYPPVVANSISVATNLAFTPVTTSVTPTSYATAGVKVTTCVAPASLPVKATLCNTNDVHSISSAVNVLTRAVGMTHSTLPITVAHAVNEIFSKTRSIQPRKIPGSIASPLLSLLSKNNPFSPLVQPQSAQSASVEPPAKSSTFQSQRVVPPKSTSGFHSLSWQSPPCESTLPVKDMSPTGVSPTTVEGLAKVCDNQCVKSQGSSVTYTLAIDTSRLCPQTSHEGQNSMLVSASVKCPAVVNASEMVSSAEKCQHFTQMPVLPVVECSKTVDSSTALLEASPTAEKCHQNFSQMPILPAAECSKTAGTPEPMSAGQKCQQIVCKAPALSVAECSKTVVSKGLPETSIAAEICQQNFSQVPILSEASPEMPSATEKCQHNVSQHNVSLLPMSSSVEKSKVVKMPEILSRTACIPEKWQQQCSSMPAWSTAEHSKNVNDSSEIRVSSVIEQSKTVDTSNKLLQAPFSTKKLQQDSSSMSVPSTVEQSQTFQIPQTLAIAEKYPTTMQTSSTVEHSREFETVQQISPAASIAEGYQQNVSTASSSSIASQNVDIDAKMPPKTLPSIILPLAAPLVSPSTINKHFVQQDLSLSPIAPVFRKSTVIPVTSSPVQEGHVSKASALFISAFSTSTPCISTSLTTPCISTSLATPCISASLITPCISTSLATPCISTSLATPCISASLTTPCISTSPVPSPVSNTSAYHQPSVTSVARDSHEQCTSQSPKVVSFPTSASLKLFATLMPEGIVIKWTFADEFLSYENQVVTYELFVRVGKEHQTSSKVLSWILLGKILPLPLPMAVTLTNYVQGESYTFLVKAVFKNCARHVYSNPGKVQL